MDRRRFLGLLKAFDDNYCPDEFIKEYAQIEARKNNQTLKQFLSSSPTTPLQVYSQINYTKLHNLVQSSNGLFQDFYSLKEEKLNALFHTLHTTNLFLKYFEEYEFDRLRKLDSRVALQNKYIDVIEDIEILKLLNANTIKILKDRQQSLNIQPTITKHKIFENLLYGLFVVLAGRDKNTFKLTKKIADITSSIMKNYYDEDHSFSKNKAIDTFTEYSYQIETAKEITLFHTGV